MLNNDQHVYVLQNLQPQMAYLASKVSSPPLKHLEYCFFFPFKISATTPAEQHMRAVHLETNCF